MVLTSLRRLLDRRPRTRRAHLEPARRGRLRYFLRLDLLEDRTLPATVFWINPAGGDWAVPSNWSTGALPGLDDDVVIDVPASIQVTHSVGVDVVRSVSSAEALTVTGGTLAVVAASEISGALTLGGGVLGGPGSVVANGPMTWTGGTLGGTGRTVANNGLAISGAGTKTLDGRTLENAAAATWEGPGDVRAGNGAAFRNL